LLGYAARAAGDTSLAVAAVFAIGAGLAIATVRAVAPLSAVRTVFTGRSGRAHRAVVAVFGRVRVAGLLVVSAREQCARNDHDRPFSKCPHAASFFADA
jgi:hypothetical protein